jgi:hypothetical protein
MSNATEAFWFMPIILATWEAEVGRTVVQGQPRQGVCKTPSQWKKTGVVVHTYNPSDSGNCKIGGLWSRMI